MDEEVQVLMELDDNNISFVAEESVMLQRLVFRLVNVMGDDSTALANMAIMFRGEPTDLVCVLGTFLALKTGMDMQRLGTGTPEDGDPRVYRISEWTPSVPLPLGDNLLDKLRLVILIDEHFDPSRVKFGGDLVPFPDVFLEGNPKMKRRMGTSTIRFRGGTLVDIEQAMSALTIDSSSEKPFNAPSKHIAPLPQTPIERDAWWIPSRIPFKVQIRMK